MSVRCNFCTAMEDVSTGETIMALFVATITSDQMCTSGRFTIVSLIIKTLSTFRASSDMFAGLHFLELSMTHLRSCALIDSSWRCSWECSIGWLFPWQCSSIFYPAAYAITLYGWSKGLWATMSGGNIHPEMTLLLGVILVTFDTHTSRTQDIDRFCGWIHAVEAPIHNLKSNARDYCNQIFAWIGS